MTSHRALGLVAAVAVCALAAPAPGRAQDPAARPATPFIETHLPAPLAEAAWSCRTGGWICRG